MVQVDVMTVKQNKLKGVVLDYETSPQKGYFFGSKWETNIVKILEFETIISASLVDFDNNKVIFKAQWNFPDWKKGIWNDKSLVKWLYEYLQKYDIIAGQNSDQFDIKVLNTRLSFWNLPQLPDSKTFDSKKIAKSKLHLPSYSLEDMLNFFGMGGKYHHIGFEMWLGSRDGDTKLQRMMKLYNNQDTMKTKRLLVEKLFPLMKQFNDFLRVNPNKEIGINCSNPACLSKNLVKAKTRRVASGFKYQYQCKDCGHYTTDPKIIKDEK